MLSSEMKGGDFMAKTNANISIDSDTIVRVEAWAKSDNRSSLSNAIETLLIRMLDIIDKETK
jgi:hypothetical protein